MTSFPVLSFSLDTLRDLDELWRKHKSGGPDATLEERDGFIGPQRHGGQQYQRSANRQSDRTALRA